MTSEDAYMAGLFEGEGCISCYIDKRSTNFRPSLRVFIKMTDREPLDLFLQFAGVGLVRGPFTRPSSGGRRKPQFCYEATGAGKVRQLYQRMAPLLGPRRSAAFQDALRRWDEATAACVPSAAFPASVAGYGRTRRLLAAFLAITATTGVGVSLGYKKQQRIDLSL